MKFRIADFGWRISKSPSPVLRGGARGGVLNVGGVVAETSSLQMRQKPSPSPSLRGRGTKLRPPQSAFRHSSALRSPLGVYPPRRALRSGITLIEILISMFVLLFGLMGVAAIFPVASHYVVEGEKRDRGSGLAQIAFEELKAREILQPKYWMYGNWSTGTPEWLLTQVPPIGVFTYLIPNPPGNADVPGPGHAFVIDPLGCASLPNPLFPFNANQFDNPWVDTTNPPPSGFAGFRWPVRRMTLPQSVGPLQGDTAETIFTLRDDLAIEQPDAGDRPSIQIWRKSDNGTPTDATDDQLLRREFTGDYTWLATVVPTRQSALLGLAPANHLYDEFYEVSTVVFYKRDTVPSATSGGSPGSERLIAADFLNSGELAIYKHPTDGSDETVDTAVEKLKPSNWIAVMGVNQTTGVFTMKWYKVLALDEDTAVQDTIAAPIRFPSHREPLRFVMVQGPDWPGAGSINATNLRVAVLPGVIDVYTRVMHVDVE